MKAIVLHESNRTMRIGLPQLNMSLAQADTIEYFLKSLPEVKEASVSERTGNATIIFKDKTEEAREKIFDALASFDYEKKEIAALVPDETGRAMNRQYQEKLVLKVGIRVLKKIFLPIPIVTAITLVKSVPYLIEAAKCLAKGKIEVPLLDGAAIGASLLRADFTTASSVMFLLSIGETLEEWTRKKSIGDLARAMSLKVDKVWLKTGDDEVLVDVTKVNVGDHILVRTSEIIPLDGRVVSGLMTVDQSAMTGESDPVSKEAGSSVYAGCVVSEGECVIEVTKTMGSGKYDEIVKMIEDTEKLKSETEAKAYHLADSLVPYSFIGSGLTWLLTRNVNKAMSFLMVDYSCALKLSIPLSIMTAMKEARSVNIDIKGGKFMEAVAEADTIVFDKTGTLTHANPTLAAVYAFDGRDEMEMLKIAACLEEHYPHSVANAVVKGALDRGVEHDEMHSTVQYVVAHGVKSTINDKTVLIGSYHFVVEDEKAEISVDAAAKMEQIDEKYSRLYLAIDGHLAAIMCISDPIREEAAEVVHKLKELGFSKVCMMTGDNRKNAKAVASMLELDDYRAEVLPEDKAAFIRKEHEAGRKVIMVGDGINDTPALSEADVGVAISDGAAIARQIADVVITEDNLYTLVRLREISTLLMERVKSNYRFIIGFNSLLIACGVLGILPPASSALLHNGSTIITGIKSTTPLFAEGSKDMIE